MKHELFLLQWDWQTGNCDIIIYSILFIWIVSIHHRKGSYGLAKELTENPEIFLEEPRALCGGKVY